MIRASSLRTSETGASPRQQNMRQSSWGRALSRGKSATFESSKSCADLMKTIPERKTRRSSLVESLGEVEKKPDAPPRRIARRSSLTFKPSVQKEESPARPSIARFSSFRRGNRAKLRDSREGSESSLTASSTSSGSSSEEFAAPVRRAPSRTRSNFASIHIMVNQSRLRADLEPLTRSVELDEMARQHAEVMAQSDTLEHSTSTKADLRAKLKARHVGENVQVGKSIRDMHGAALQEGSSRWANLSDPRFHEFGMFAARSANGNLYMCQLFR